MDTRGGPAILQGVGNGSIPTPQLKQVKCQFPRKEAANVAVEVPSVRGDQFASRTGDFQSLFQHLQGIRKDFLGGLRRMDTI